MRILIGVVLLVLSTRSFTQSVENFSLADIISNKTVALTDYKDSPGIIILFTSAQCAFDEQYHARIKALESSTLPLVMINANKQETRAEMIAVTKKWNLKAPYLADPDQLVMKQFNASRNPQVFLLKNTNGNFSVFYEGAIDDNPQGTQEVGEKYLITAIEALLAGKSIALRKTRPVGCVIR